MQFTNFQLENFDGSTFDFYDYNHGSYVLIFFFRGAWCNLCKKQLMEAQQNIEFFNQHNIKLLAVAPDSSFKLSLMKTFLKVEFPVLADDKFEVVDKLNLKETYKDHETSKPAFFLINSDHEILTSYIGKEYDDRLSIKQVMQQIKVLENFQ